MFYSIFMMILGIMDTKMRPVSKNYAISLSVLVLS